MNGTELDAAQTHAADATHPSPSSQFRADLTAAMRLAAQEASKQAVQQLRDEAKGIVAGIREQSGHEAAELRKQAEGDLAGIREWSKAEIARIREETEARIAERRAGLDARLEVHAAEVETRIEHVHGSISAFEAEIDTFLDRLLAETDPTRFATLFEQLPEAPALAPVEAGGDAAQDADTLDAGASAIETDTAAEIGLEAVAGVAEALDQTEPTEAVLEMEPAEAAVEAEPVETPAEAAVEAEPVETPADTADAQDVADEAEAEAELAEVLELEAVPAGQGESEGSLEDAPVGWGAMYDERAGGYDAGDGSDDDADDGDGEVDRSAIMAALEAAAEAVVAAEAAADSATQAEAAADLAETAAELLSGKIGHDEDGEATIDAEGDAAIAARLEAGGAEAQESFAVRLHNLLAGRGETVSSGSGTTHLVVTGLVSVASIASFKRHLGRVSGVQSVTVSSGPDGEFVFSATHSDDVSFRDVVPGLPGFGARITGTGDGYVQVSARDLEVEPR